MRTAQEDEQGKGAASDEIQNSPMNIPTTDVKGPEVSKQTSPVELEPNADRLNGTTKGPNANVSTLEDDKGTQRSGDSGYNSKDSGESSRNEDQLKGGIETVAPTLEAKLKGNAPALTEGEGEKLLPAA